MDKIVTAVAYRGFILVITERGKMFVVDVDSYGVSIFVRSIATTIPLEP
jgi:hypothetical protein